MILYERACEFSRVCLCVLAYVLCMRACARARVYNNQLSVRKVTYIFGVADFLRNIFDELFTTLH